MTGDLRPLAAVLAPLLAVPLILLSSRRPNLRESWTFAAALTQFSVLFSMLPEVLSGSSPESLLPALGPGLSLHLRADPLGFLFALLASGLWMLTSVYSVGYMRAERSPRQTGYFAAFAVCLSAAAGIALAANLLVFVVFYEILTVATYPLVVHTRKPEALAAGRKYLIYTLSAGQCLLVAAVWAQSLAPGAEFAAGGFLSGKASPPVLALLFFLFMAGVGVKAAVMPLHGWLPAAMAAPVPVSALLHAVAVVKAGAFGCVRISGFVFGIDLIRELGADRVLALAAGATIVIASLRALSEMDLKRRLAYSTISQLSYIVLGTALGSPAALAGAIFHIAAHGVMKITLFFCAGSFHSGLHTYDIKKLAGAGRRMPVTMTAFAVGALGLTGMPLLAGFVSKWNLGWGALQAGQGLYIAVLVASALLNFAYFFPIIYEGFWGGEGKGLSFEEPRPELWIPPALTAVLALILGLFPQSFLSLLRLAWAAASAIGVQGGPL